MQTSDFYIGRWLLARWSDDHLSVRLSNLPTLSSPSLNDETWNYFFVKNSNVTRIITTFVVMLSLEWKKRLAMCKVDKNPGNINSRWSFLIFLLLKSTNVMFLDALIFNFVFLCQTLDWSFCQIDKFTG